MAEKKPLERADRIDDFGSNLKKIDPEIADQVLKSAIANMNRLVQLKTKSDKRVKEAVTAEIKEHFVSAANLYWEAGAALHNRFENAYSQALKLMAIARCLFRLRMHLLSKVYFERAKTIFAEEKAKNKMLTTDLNEGISICDEYIEEIEAVYPYISKEIQEMQLYEEYICAISSFVNFDRKSLSFFNFAVFLTGKVVLKNFKNIPRNEVAAVYEEAARAYLAYGDAYPLAYLYAKDALAIFTALKDENSVKRINLLFEEIAKKRKENEK
jgi:hypothetical protein